MRIGVLSAALSLLAMPVLAVEKAFLLNGTNVTLTEVTDEVGVRFGAMRFNPINSRWNLDLSLTNRSYRVMPGPLVVLIEGYSGTSGPLLPDGTDGSNPSKAYYNFTAQSVAGQLWPGETTGTRTIQLGYNGGSPNLNPRVFANLVASEPGLALVRTLTEMGQPLPGATVLETGPAGSVTRATDSNFALATLGGTNGEHTWMFTAMDRLPVWRRETLQPGAVTLLFNPRLVRRATPVVIPLAGGLATTSDGALRVQFNPGAFSQNVSASLTPLSAQTLPMLLPPGWSPLQAWSLELSAEPAIPVQATFFPWGSISPADQAALVRWNSQNFRWDVLQLFSGAQSNALSVTLPGSATYAVVVADAGVTAPPAVQIGQPLVASPTAFSAYGSLTAGGQVSPVASLASPVPELVTATAGITVTNLTSSLVSGLPLRCEVRENYQLLDGTRRTPPQYENYLVGYQRPGDASAATLQASFPMQPLLLFGRDELDVATVCVDLLPLKTFTGRVLDSRGGQLPGPGIVISAATGDLTSRQAIQLRLLNPTNFTASISLPVWSAFDLSVGGIAAGHHLSVQAGGLSANSYFVLTRVLSSVGQYGLEPVERLLSDTNGVLSTLEPTSGDRLPGIDGAGQYLLVQVNAPQGLVSGIAKNVSGQAVAGLPVQVTGQPWLTYSGTNGIYRLIAPAGPAEIVTTDPGTGDLGSAIVTVTNPGIGATADVGAIPSGPRVVSINPTNSAVNVSRVTAIVIHFSEPINPGSLVAGSVQLLGISNQPVAVSRTLNLQNTILTLIPVAQLSASTLHTILLSTNLTDTTALPLEGPRQFTFTTESDVLDRLVAQVISYEPTNGRAAMYGSPGTAEPNSAVILVNETSGQTATILSKPDGSFSNSIPAGVDDFLSAVLVNQNGTRNTIPVSRQIFQDGSVGLFNGGGILEAQSDGGPVQVLIEPGAIANKARFKIEPVPVLDLLNYVHNTPPANAHLVGGFKVTTSGDPLSQPLDFAVVVSTNALGLPAGISPEQAGFALVVPQDVDGVIAYQMVDRMHYENGKLVTHSPPFEGYLGGEDFLAMLSVPSLSGSISGQVLVSDTDPSQNGGANAASATPVPGALVSLDPDGIVSGGRPGRLKPGTMYARANANGFFAFQVPVDPFNAGGGVFTVFATHQQYPTQRARKVVTLPSNALDSFVTGNILSPVNLYFVVPPGSATNDTLAPELSLAHSPDLPPAGTNASANVRLIATDNAHSIAGIGLEFDSAISLVTGVTVDSTDVVITNIGLESIGAFGQRASFTVSCRLPAIVILRASAEDVVGNRQEQRYSIRFGGTEPSTSNPLGPADPNDHTGPMVIASDPQPSAVGLPPGHPIKLSFSEPINRAMLQDPSAIQIAPALSPPVLELSGDQRELTLTYGDMQPGVQYTLTLTSGIKDLAGNRLDQDPKTTDSDSYVLAFKTSASLSGSFVGTTFGGGAVAKGIYSYVLDRTGSLDGSLGVYDLSSPTQAVLVARLNLPSYPRDLVLIPTYSYKTKSTDALAVTNDLLAVAGGLVTGGEAGGQFLWIIDISNPLNPRMIATTLLTLATDSAVTKLAWSPPELGYLELSAGYSQVGLVNLQALILGNSLSGTELSGLPVYGTPGVDQNGDGDYVDAGDQLPVLGRATGGGFWGMDPPVPVGDTDQPINDFALADQGRFVGAVLDRGKVLGANGSPTSVVAERSYRTLLNAGIPPSRISASYEFTNGTPMRVSILRGVRIPIGSLNNSYDVALVSLKADPGGTNQLVVLDITDAGKPRLLNQIPIATEHGDGIYSVIPRDDGKLLLATSQDVLVLNPARLGESQPQNGGTAHPSIIGVITGAGSGARTFFGSVSGLVGTSSGGRNMAFLTAPDLSFVFAPATTPFNPQSLVSSNETAVAAQLAAFSAVQEMGPSRFRPVAGITPSTLSPPSPLTHYYVLVHAPGSAGPTIDLALESLNSSGYPLRQKGYLFPPVHCLGTNGLAAIGQSPGTFDAPVAAARAWRLSANPASQFYNVYLSKPIALVGEEMSIPELAAAKAVLDREIIWSGSYLRATLDPGMSSNSVLQAFVSAPNVAEGIIEPGAGILSGSFPADYIMGPNPEPIRGEATLSGALDTVGAHNAEFTLQTTDLGLPGRRLPLTFTRTARGQALYDGPFGRNWDYNFNQRIVELREDLFLPGSKLPLVVRDTPANSEIGESKDLLLFNGAGRTMLYKYSGTNVPPEFAQDPLVATLGWNQSNNVARYYQTPAGMFNMLVKFPGGEFARLEPDGMRFWYNPAGRLIKVYDRYETNSLELVYDSRGDLVQLKDELRRTVNIGYWRTDNSPRSDADMTTNNPAAIGKIARFQDYSGRDVLFMYDQNGRLQQQLGPNVQTVSPENLADAFTGRYTTTYLYGDLGNIPGGAGNVIGSIPNGSSGAPAASVTGWGGLGRDTAKTLLMMNKPVKVELGQSNSAVAISQGGATTRLTAQDNSTTDYTFDTFGRPTKITLSGSNGVPLITEFGYTNGLVQSVIYPEGNSIEYEYDFANPNLRSRGNLKHENKKPGSRPGPTLTSSQNYDNRYNLPSGTQTDFKGNATDITLSSDKRVVEYMTKGGETEHFLYNPFGQLQASTSAQGITTQFDYYPTNGFLKSRTLPNLTTTWTYTGNPGLRGMADSVTDPAGIVTIFQYDELDRVIVSQRSGARQSFAYDSTGGLAKQMTGVETNRDLVERFDRDGFGNLATNRVENVEVDGTTKTLATSYERDEFFRVKAATDPGGVRNEVDYDFAGRTTNVRVPGTYEESFGYDRNGNLTTEQVGTATNILTYDGLDRPAESLAPNGARTTIYYDANDNPTNIFVRDANDGDRLLMQSGAGYDALDRPTTLTEETGVGKAVNSIQYLTAQRQVVFTDPVNSQTTVSLDNVGRVGQIQDPTATLTYAYDVPGRSIQSTLTDATGPSSDVSHYDPLGHLDQYQDASQQTYSFARGFDGRLMTATTPEQQVYHNTHTVLGEPLSMTRPNGQTLTASYDGRRELTSLAPTPVPGVGMSFSYDASGRLTNSLAADNKGATHRAFNAFMQPTLSDLPRGLVVSNAYDQTGRRIQREITGLPSGPREDFWSYDALDRVKSATNPFAIVSYTYDLQGYARQIQFGQFGTNWILGQIADLMGVRTNLTYPDGLVITLSRDTNSRLDKILPAGLPPVIRSSTYATSSQVGTRVLGTNNITSEFIYDLNRRPLVRRFRRASDSSVLAEVRYAYDGSGMQTARQFIHRGGRTDLFGYDGSHKVTRADIGARPPVTGELTRTVTGFNAVGWAAGLYAREYGYTATEVLSGVNLRNPDALIVPPFATNFAAPDITLHVPQIDGVNRSRDDAGNVTSGRVWVRIPGNPVPQPVLANFVYDELNQLTQVVRADGVLVENTFGPTGLRIQRRVTGSTALCVPSNYEYLYEGINLIEIRELDQPGHPLRARFYYGDDGDELVAGDLWDAGSGLLRRCYYLTDALGSVMALSDAAGNVIERYDYDTWGEATIQSPDTAAPRVSGVTREGNDLVIQFTEAVLPALPANDGRQLVRSLRNPAEAFQVLSNGVVLAGRIQFEERSTNRAFGTSFRFVATNALPDGLQLAVAAGVLVDGAGNSNPQEQLNLTTGTNAYSGPAAGSTAPITLTRSAVTSPFAFQGQIYDSDAGLIYMRARFYDTSLGEFLQRDPLGYEDSVNQYAGFANNPVNKRDPTGLDDEDPYFWENVGSSVAHAVVDLMKIPVRMASSVYQAGLIANDVKNMYGAEFDNIFNDALDLPTESITPGSDLFKDMAANPERYDAAHMQGQIELGTLKAVANVGTFGALGIAEGVYDATTKGNYEPLQDQFAGMLVAGLAGKALNGNATIPADEVWEFIGRGADGPVYRISGTKRAIKVYDKTVPREHFENQSRGFKLWDELGLMDNSVPYDKGTRTINGKALNNFSVEMELFEDFRDVGGILHQSKGSINGSVNGNVIPTAAQKATAANIEATLNKLGPRVAHDFQWGVDKYGKVRVPDPARLSQSDLDQALKALKALKGSP